jgi:hypothetical protein
MRRTALTKGYAHAPERQACHYFGVELARFITDPESRQPAAAKSWF